MQFVSPGRPRRPREIELIQQVAEEFKDDLRAVYIDGLLAERAVTITDKEGNERVVYVKDLGHRLATAKEIQDRLHGRPKQQTEITGADDGPVRSEMIVVDDREAAQAAQEFLRRIRKG